MARTDTCWLWTGAKQSGGYGRFLADGKVTLVHRWTYERFVGSIPDGLTIDHACRNTSCVNPAHLRVMSREENSRLANTNKDKTHCDAGHALTPENVYTPPKRPTVRDCRACRRERSRAHYLRLTG